MILNFLYVCQSVCMLTSLPKLDKGISPFLDEISFWNYFETFLDIGSLIFTLLGWAYILTSEFLCAGLNFKTSDLVTFWFSEGQYLRLLVLLTKGLMGGTWEALQALNKHHHSGSSEWHTRQSYTHQQTFPVLRIFALFYSYAIQSKDWLCTWKKDSLVWLSTAHFSLIPCFQVTLPSPFTRRPSSFLLS